METPPRWGSPEISGIKEKIAEISGIKKKSENKKLK